MLGERFHVKGAFSVGTEVDNQRVANKAFILIINSVCNMFRS